MPKSTYIGRFAPTPSGDLHFGSLVTALASYLQAKSKQGKWLVRIENIDRQREVANAATKILSTLENHGLLWDDEIIYQSDRTAIYDEFLTFLIEQNLTYACDCSRARLQSLTYHYDNRCRAKSLNSAQNAIRFKNEHPVGYFLDQHLSHQFSVGHEASADFIIKRKDGFYSYNFVVVIDDYLQNITEVVRGEDLLSATFWQLSLYQALNKKAPEFMHVPLVKDHEGKKLSKQNHAPALTTQAQYIKQNLFKALCFLSQPLPENSQDITVPELINWAIQHWDLQNDY